MVWTVAVTTVSVVSLRFNSVVSLISAGFVVSMINCDCVIDATDCVCTEVCTDVGLELVRRSDSMLVLTTLEVVLAELEAVLAILDVVGVAVVGLGVVTMSAQKI